MTVERVSYLHEREIDEFLGMVEHAFRPDVAAEVQLVRKAVSFVRLGSVRHELTAPDGHEVGLTVMDGMMPRYVNVDFSEMELACSCKVDGWCGHKVAVLFYLYSQFNSLTDWVHQWQQREVEQMALSISERTPEAWNDVLYRLTRPLRDLQVNESPNVFLHESSLLDQKMIPLSPFEWEWKPLFELFYRLHLMDSAWEYLYRHLEEANHFAYREWQMKAWLNEQVAKLRAIVHTLCKKPRLFETDAFYAALKSNARELVLHHEGLFPARLEIYAIMWDLLYPNAAEREREMASLVDEEKADAPYFAAFFYLTHGDDDALKEIAEKTGGAHVGYWLPLADHAAELENEEALFIIMDTVYPHIGPYFGTIPSSTERFQFIRKIDGLLEEADFSEERREELFMLYGKEGVSTFGDFLIERQRFSEWAALMHRFNIPYDGIDPDTMKFVMQYDPAAVMPLLHTYAMRFIQEKNRHSYRRAVRLFKNMKAGAKRSGKADFWNRYIDTVRDQFRRLRALSEEMEKGNLNL